MCVCVCTMLGCVCVCAESWRNKELLRCSLTASSIFSLFFPPQENSTHAEQWSNEAGALFSQAISGPMKTNLLINFAYADFEEVRVLQTIFRCRVAHFLSSNMCSLVTLTVGNHLYHEESCNYFVPNKKILKPR